MKQFSTKNNKLQNLIKNGYSFVYTKSSLFIYLNNNLISTYELKIAENYLSSETITYHLYLSIINKHSKNKTTKGIILYKLYKTDLYNYIINKITDIALSKL